MIDVVICCDLCKQPLPVRQRKAIICGNEVTLETVEMRRTTVWNTRSLFQHLCSECALKIDNELLKLKLSVLEGQ